jgi:transposase-like protein
MSFSLSQEPEVTRIFPSIWRSITIVALSEVASLSKTFWGVSVLISQNSGQGQMKPEQLEIARLKREVLKLKAERDILKKAAAYFAKEST